MIATLGKTVKSDDKGGFRIADIPPGAYLVEARALGFAMYKAVTQFGDAENVERPIVLPRITSLDTVSVVGDANVPQSYLDHRAVGLGHFMTRADLEKMTGRKLSGALAQTPGLGVVLGRSGQAWVMSKRYSMSINSIGSGGKSKNTPGDPVWHTETDAERLMGFVTGCYARVYLDKTLLNPTTPAEPVDINTYAPENLEAIEYFSGPAQTPLEYSKLNSSCGVLVLHSRRSR